MKKNTTTDKPRKSPSNSKAKCGCAALTGSETNWKMLAWEAVSRLEWMLSRFKPIHGSTLYNPKTGKTCPWQDPIMDLIDKFPNATIDREAVYACQLPRKERNKWFKKNREPISQNDQALPQGD